MPSKKKKSGNKKYSILAVVAAFVVGVALSALVPVSAQSGQSALSWVLERAAERVAEKAIESDAPVSDLAGGVSESTTLKNVTPLRDLTLKDSDNNFDRRFLARRMITDIIDVSSSSTFLSFQNRTGSDIWITDVTVRLFSAPTSSGRIAMGTSTVPSVATSSLVSQAFGASWTTSTALSAMAWATSTNASVANHGDSRLLLKDDEYLVGNVVYTDTFNYNPTLSQLVNSSNGGYYIIEYVETATSTN